MTRVAADLPRVRPALRRRTERRLVSGVAGGLADWLNASPVFVRVVIALLLTLEGRALWAYAGAALLLPPRGRDRPGLDNVIAMGRVGVTAFVYWLVADIHEDYISEAPHIGLPYFGLLLLGLAVVLAAGYLRDRPRTAAEERAAVLGSVPLVLSVGALAGGVALVENVRWERFLPVCVLIAGAGLLAGAWVGRPRPSLAPAVVAVVLVGYVIAAGVRLDGGVGDVQIAPSRVEGGNLVVRRAVGDVELDLRRTVSERPLVVRASVGKGNLAIALPDRGRIMVDAHVGAGKLVSNPISGRDRSLNGLDLDVSDSWRPRDSRSRRPRKILAPAIHIIASVGVGELKATRTGGISPFPVGP